MIPSRSYAIRLVYLSRVSILEVLYPRRKLGHKIAVFLVSEDHTKSNSHKIRCSISFDCRTQSNSIHGLSSISFDFRTFDLLCRELQANPYAAISSVALADRGNPSNIARYF